MGLIVTVTFSLALWVILWSIQTTVNLTSFDSFMIAVTVMLLGVMSRALVRYLPGRRR
ncbi:MAG TPA: hypothetical protein VKU89_00400 [Solirubrobacteraceae bacterium]|nr:hypothetical protein [Solirubrobacteraceae bacterium]